MANQAIAHPTSPGHLQSAAFLVQTSITSSMTVDRVIWGKNQLIINCIDKCKDKKGDTFKKKHIFLEVQHANM